MLFFLSLSHKPKIFQMKKTLILLFAICCSAYSLNAQIHGGLKGGLSMATMNFEVPSGIDNPMKLGFWGGGFLVVGDGLFRFQPEVLYVQKGASIENTSTLEYARSTLNYIEVPLMTRLHIGIDIVNIYLNVGVYGGYWLSAKTTTYAINAHGQYETNTHTHDFEEEYDNRFDGGLVFGAGVKVLFFFVEGRYSMGMVNSQKEGENKDKSKLSYWGVALGVQF
jgi:hypothetical protein